jgi:adenylate cyclase
VRKVRLATACQQAGLPMDGIAAAIRGGRLSFAFLEAAPYRRWAVRKGRTYRQVSQQTGVPLELLDRALEAIGFARMAPDEPMREDELEIVPLLQRGLSSGIFDLDWLTRVGRGYAEGLRLIAQVEIELWQARFVAPLLAAGADQQTAQELAWTESLVEDIEAALEDTGVLGRPGRVPAMCFLDLVGYTRLTEEQGDQAAAELAGRLAVLVGRSSREHGGVPVKWLGDGVMVHFRDPAGAVLAALQLVEQLPEAGLPPARRGGGRPGGGPGRRLLRPHREPGRADRRLCPRRSGAGKRARGRAGAAPGGDLRGAGAGATGGHRPSPTAAGGPPVLTSDALASSREAPPNAAGRAGQPRPATTHKQMIRTTKGEPAPVPGDERRPSDAAVGVDGRTMAEPEPTLRTAPRPRMA